MRLSLSQGASPKILPHAYPALFPQGCGFEFHNVRFRGQSGGRADVIRNTPTGADPPALGPPVCSRCRL
jgi:hypothetical protein